MGPNDEILRTHSTVNMAVKIRLRSANTSENSRGAPWNLNYELQRGEVTGFNTVNNNLKNLCTLAQQLKLGKP